MALGHLSGILGSLALVLGGGGFALFLLRKNFKNGVEVGVPKKKAKIKKVSAKPAPQIQEKPELDTTPVVAQTVESRTEFSFDLQSNASVAAVASSEAAVPQLLASSQNELTPLATAAESISSPVVSEQIEVPVAFEQSQVPEVPEIPVDLSSAVKKSEVSATVPSHRTYQVTSIHVAIWPYDRVLEKLNPDHAYEALNEFHGIGVSWAEKNQVIYERSSGASFYLHWTDEAKAADALRITLELRQEFMEWNDVRRAQGYPPFMVVMGADLGLAIWCAIGPDGYRRESVVGEVTARARALSQISLAVGTNLLASDTLWSSISARYLGEKVASATLTAFKNLTVCYKIQGYYDEQGKEVWMRGADHDLDPESCHADAPRIEKSEPTKLWRVNNGSQILGPMSAKDVGRALYALDLDFDCECWVEGEFNRVAIERSGMFGAGVEDNARFWVFDGDTLHGPLTEEFLKTGMGKKVYPRDSYVCEKSTVNGWKPLMELRASINAASEPAPIAAAPIAAAPVVEAPPAPVLQDVVSLSPSELSPPESEPVLVAALEQAEEVEEPTDNIDLAALNSAQQVVPEPPAEPVLSFEPPAPPMAPPAPPVAPVVELRPLALEEAPLPPAAPLLEQAPPPPAPPVLEQAPVIEQIVPVLQQAPAKPAEVKAEPAPASEAASAIELPVLMPVLEAVASPRKSA